MGLISATSTVAATALVLPAGKLETYRLQDKIPPMLQTKVYCVLSETEQQQLFVKQAVIG